MKSAVYVFYFLILTAPSVALSESIFGNITEIKYHSENHANNLVRHYVLFKLSENISPCTWLYLDPNDQTESSAIMVAKFKNTGVRVEYVSDGSVSPWGDASSCQAVSIEFL